MSEPVPFPLELADRCVKCGLCLPHCPTYALDGVEGESPRGRIALLQGLATGRLEAGTALQAHLERCLGCRACERACPAGVPYGELIDAGRALLVQRGVRPPVLQRWLRGVLTHPRRLRAAMTLARLPGARWLARALGGLPARALALLPPAARAPEARLPEPDAQAEAVQREAWLFEGCVGSAVDGQAIDDVARVLAAAGWRLRRPPRPGCCGAIELHAGEAEAGRARVAAMLAAFPGTVPIVACASGCAATMLEYGRISAAAGASFAQRVREPAQLLAESRLQLRAGRYRRIALHLPCTQRNVTGAAAVTQRLLERIPGLELSVLPSGCCGAGGETFLARPALADALLAPWLAKLQRDPPDALVSSNLGCALHFSAGLRRAGLDLPVLHPATVLADALE